MNNLSLSPDKIQSTDCKSFGHRLATEGLKPDPEKVKAIVDMEPPQSIQALQSFNSMVNYLRRFSPILTELSEPQRILQKWNTVWAWESEQQTAFDKIKTILTTKRGTYIQNRKFIKIRYTDCGQSLKTTQKKTIPSENMTHTSRPKRLTKRLQRLIESINYIWAENTQGRFV